MKLGELGEFGLIKRIASRVKNGDGVVIGIGDDAAATATSPGCLNLLTSDMLVEGIHFDLGYSDPHSLGRKSLAVNISDVAAMGGKPRNFLLSLAIPSGVNVEFIDSFCGGMLEIAEEFGVTLIGGDTCASHRGLVVSVTLIGEQAPEKIIRRNGATPGDLVLVSGNLGDSALGLEMLRNGQRDGYAVRRHLDPTPRVREGVGLAEANLATSMIDISDGVLADLGHILEQSRAGATICPEKIPRSDFFLVNSPHYMSDPEMLALAGGEDYELLFTARPGDYAKIIGLFQELGTPVTCIGQIIAEQRLLVKTASGEELAIDRRGYNHFARNP